MQIALVGYGKMGRMIEEIAIERGHQVVLKLTRNNSEELNESSARNIDVAIEFTSPESAYGNVKKCLDLGLPVVSGSTGWNEKLEAAKEYCQTVNGALLHASNFSIGVNIFFEINKRLAALMANQPDYDVMIREIHHTQKKDAPSGTAVTLAEQIIDNLPRKTGWEKEESSDAEKISIVSERIDPAPGTHHVKYSSVIDDIELIHTAHSRKGFAYGAVLAAEYISGKKGIFSMKDVLDL